MTPVGPTPNTTSRPGSPSAAASAGGGGRGQDQRVAGHGRGRAALGIGGDDVDLVALPVRLPDTAMAELLHVGDQVDVVAADPQGGPAATVAREALVLALPPPPADAAADGLPGRLVVLGLRADEVPSVAGASVTRFLTVAYAG